MKIGIVMFFVHHSLVARTTVAYNEKYAFMVSVPNVGWPAALDQGACSRSVESTRLGCAIGCASILPCLSTYAVHENDKWTCHRCTDFDTSGSYFFGPGVYSYVMNKDLSPSIPYLEDGIFKKTDIYEGRLTAFYTCSTHRAAQIRLAVDEATGLWPHLGHEQCLEDLCDQEVLTATLFDVSISRDGFAVTPRCKADEVATGYNTFCAFDGQWNQMNRENMGCISPTCMRMNHVGRAFYNGVLATTVSDAPCDLWINLHHVDDSAFLEDGSKSAARNYCRDVENIGSPACYSGGSSSRCNVAICV